MTFSFSGLIASSPKIAHRREQTISSADTANPQAPKSGAFSIPGDQLWPKRQRIDRFGNTPKKISVERFDPQPKTRGAG
jgi:hypothetical protein